MGLYIEPALYQSRSKRGFIIMRSVKKMLCVALTLAIVSGCAGISDVSALSESIKKKTADTQTAPTREEVQATLAMDTFNAINAYRKSKGLNSLTWNDTLSTVAFKRAKEVSRKFSHTRPNGSSYDSLYTASGLIPAKCGEGLGTGFYTGSDMLVTWLASDFHKQMIEDGTYSYIAVGAYITDKGVPYIVAEFM